MTAGIDVGTRSEGGRGLSLSFSRLPYWLILLLLCFAVTFFVMLTRQEYSSALTFIAEGLKITIGISIVGYIIALVLGLVVGLGRVTTNPILSNMATLYVEIFRGVPLFVIILYTSFVLAPWLDQTLGLNNQLVRNKFMVGVIALALGYGAYLAEVFRAGIESIERGQTEAARSLGMNRFQTMRFIILPQAIRRVLPPLGNDFIAIMKDSSLLSVIAVQDLTYWTKSIVATTANTFLGWNSVALLYLILSLVLSLGVRAIERYSNGGQRR